MPDVPVATAPPTTAPGVRDLLRLPDFRRLYVGQAVSDLGDGMTYLALFLLVLDLTGSTSLIALMSILVALPPVTIGLFAGAWADRADRRRIMVGSDALRAALVLALVPAAIAGNVPVIFALATAQAVVGTFFSPARAALVPRVVPKASWLAANSLGQATRMIAGVAGALVTGVVAAATGNAWPVFIVDAATFLVSVVLVAGVTRGAGRPDATAVERIRSRGMGGAVADGLRLIARSRPLVAALGGVSVTMLGVGAINVLFVPFLVRELGGSPAWAGPMEGAQTLSMILASAVVPGLAARRGASTVMTAGLAGIGACIVLFGLAPAPWAMLLLSFAVGWFVMPVQAITMTIVQQATTDETRGRVAGALNASMQTASIASMAVAGVMADVVGMRAVFFAGGAVAMAAAAVAWVLFRTGNETDRAAAKPARPVGADGS